VKRKNFTDPIIAFLLVLPSLWWAYRKEQIFAWDEAAYGGCTIDLWILLTRHPKSWLSALFDVMLNSRPPLLAWIGQFFVPVGQLFHSVDFGLLASVNFVQAITLVLLMAIGRALDRGKLAGGLIAALMVASSGIFIELSTLYLVEPTQLLGATLAYWVAIKSTKSSAIQTMSWLLLSVFVAAMSKASGVLYCIAPIVYTIYNVIRFRRIDGIALSSWHAERLTLMAAAVLFSASIFWYWRNFSNVLIVVRDAAQGAAALNYGEKLPLLDKLELWRQIISNFVWSQDLTALGVILLGLVIALTVRKMFIQFQTRQRASEKSEGEPSADWQPKLDWRGKLDWRIELALVAVAQIVLILAVLSLSISEPPRYAMAILPSLAVLLALMTGFLDNKLVNGLLIVFFCTQATLVHLNRCQNTSRPILAKAAEIDGLIDVLAVNPKTNICGTNYNWLNANTLNYISSKHELETHKSMKWESRVDNWTYMPLDVFLKTAGDFHSVKHCYFVSVSSDKQAVPVDFANRPTLPVLVEILKDKTFSRVPFKSQFGIVVFSRNED
jgi:hypothetical protein